MSKFVLGSSMVWVVLCLITGLVLVSLPHGSDGSMLRRLSQPRKSVSAEPVQREGDNTATTQVRIEGTPSGEGKDVQTSVKIKK